MSRTPFPDGPDAQSQLFDVGDPVPATPALGEAKPRYQAADRCQIELRPAALDELLPHDHPARTVWEYVEGLDLSALYEQIRAVEGHAGRSPIDPKILVALWLYATIDGVGSARALDRLCGEHVAYQWICGGVSVNYHTLADFRTAHGELLDDLLTHSVAVLMHEGLVSVERVAQDGMRVRASAGAASFHRQATLEEQLAAAETRVRQLREEIDADPAASSQRQRRARERATRERAERIRQALDQMSQVQARKKPSEKEQARISSTDPDARVMKMADGGFRPAYNVQFATDTASQVITGVDVVNAGSDQGQMPPMVAQHQERYRQVPRDYLVDGGFVNKQDIETVSNPAASQEGSMAPAEASTAGTTVYAPVPQPKDAERERYQPLAEDTPAVAAWRQRMGTAEAKEIFKQRAATAECVNAQARNRGLYQFRVRGLTKVKAVALWYAIAHNLLRTLALRAQVAAGAA